MAPARYYNDRGQQKIRATPNLYYGGLHPSIFNSRDIETGFYKDKPFADLQYSIFNSTILPNLNPGSSSTLLYLKNRHNTEASTRISKRIADSKNLFHIGLTLESPPLNPLPGMGCRYTLRLVWYAIFPILSARGALIHNARYALVAGMAHGMQKYLLMLEEGDFFIPIDYRDLRSVSTTVQHKRRHTWSNGFIQLKRLGVRIQRPQKPMCSSHLP